MSSDKYCQALVKNVEADLEKKGIRLPSKCYTPMSSGYRPEMDCSCELKAEGIRRYQEIIGQLRWAIEDIITVCTPWIAKGGTPRAGITHSGILEVS